MDNMGPEMLYLTFSVLWRWSSKGLASLRQIRALIASKNRLSLRQMSAQGGHDLRQMSAQGGHDLRQMSAQGGHDLRQMSAQVGHDLRQMSAQGGHDLRQMSAQGGHDLRQMSAQGGHDLRRRLKPQAVTADKPDTRQPSGLRICFAPDTDQEQRCQ